MIFAHRKKSFSISEFPLLRKVFSSEDTTRTSCNERILLPFEGRDRYYEVHLPKGCDSSKPVALVLNFHGGAATPCDQQLQSGMDVISDCNGFIAVYPAGTGIKMNQRLFFNAGNVFGYARTNNVNDIGFVEHIIEDVVKKFPIDRKRIFATGFSNGAKFCYLLATKLSHLIAAIGPVSGTMALPLSEFKPKRCVPIIHFHGTLDSVNPYHGGSGLPLMEKIQGIKVDNNSVEDMINHCVGSYGCQKNISRSLRKGNATCEVYGPGKEESEVVLWTLMGGGHTWPGGQRTGPKFMVGNVNGDICASERIWKFFESHPMREQ